MTNRVLSICCLLLFILPYVTAAYSESSGLTCKQHPAFKSTLKPVLVRSWYLYRFSTSPKQAAYFPRFKNITFAPVSNPTSTKYKNLDYFFTGGQTQYPTFRMYFQRKAIVNLIVPVPFANYSRTKTASFPGDWKSEGWIKRVAGSSTLTFGVHQKLQVPSSQYWYMFSMKTSTKNREHFIDLPQTAFVKQTLKHLGVDGSFDLLISEQDGSASGPVGTFRGKVIAPNTQCPKALHDVWKTTDNDDPDTRGVEFRTWHPNWDPCYWCAYDHDHGSSPYHIFGYAPKYEYVARKNNNEPESHNGFKGFVYRAKGLFVYYSVHILNSSMRRVTARVHTIQLVIANATTKEILVNIAHKGDFGWQSVRLSNFNSFRALTPADQAIRDQQDSAKSGRKMRSIPVFDDNGGAFQSRNPKILGQYEEWQTMPICAKREKAARPQDNFRVILKEPVTGIKSITEQSVRVNMGMCIPGSIPRGTECKETTRTFLYNPGVIRALFVLDIKIADSLCPDSKKGVFYTDVTASRTFAGPGPTHVRQYIKPGFSTILSGRFEPIEPWVGLHGYYGRGFFHDHGYGINPLEN